MESCEGNKRRRISDDEDCIPLPDFISQNQQKKEDGEIDPPKTLFSRSYTEKEKKYIRHGKRAEDIKFKLASGYYWKLAMKYDFEELELVGKAYFLNTIEKNICFIAHLNLDIEDDVMIVENAIDCILSGRTGNTDKRIIKS